MFDALNTLDNITNLAREGGKPAIDQAIAELTEEQALLVKQASGQRDGEIACARDGATIKAHGGVLGAGDGEIFFPILEAIPPNALEAINDHIYRQLTARLATQS